jgi:hypothetical protein
LQVEKLQLSDIKKLQTALTLHMVIAWRINRLMRLGRTLPDLPTDLLFEADEWRAPFILNKKAVPKTVLTANTVIRLIAQLGGLSGQKERWLAGGQNTLTGHEGYCRLCSGRPIRP